MNRVIHNDLFMGFYCIGFFLSRFIRIAIKGDINEEYYSSINGITQRKNA